MKYVKVPKPVVIRNVKTAGGDAVMLSLADYNDQFVWPAQKWRDVAGHKLFMSLYQKLLDQTPGASVELSDAEHEAYMEVATQRGKDLPPHLAAAINLLLDPLYEATSVNPVEN